MGRVAAAGVGVKAVEVPVVVAGAGAVAVAVVLVMVGSGGARAGHEERCRDEVYRHAGEGAEAGGGGRRTYAFAGMRSSVIPPRQRPGRIGGMRVRG